MIKEALPSKLRPHEHSSREDTMALLTSSSRRFTRSTHYSHEQRRHRVRARIDLVAPTRPIQARPAVVRS